MNLHIIQLKLYKLFAKLRLYFYPEHQLLFYQVNRTFEHLNLDNAVIHSHRILPYINNYCKDKTIKILSVGSCNMLEIYTFLSYGFTNISGVDLISTNRQYIKIMDMHNMTFDDNSFDLLYCSGTFHCTYNVTKLVKEFVRVIKNGGIIVICVPVNFKRTNVYVHDVKSVTGLKHLFESNFRKMIWSETVKPKSAFNPNNNTVIRSMFTIEK